MDEFDIEITHLHDRPAPTDAATSAPTDHEAPHEASEVARRGAHALSTRLLSHRQRHFRMLAVVLTILLPLVLILGINPNTRAAVDSLLHPVTTFANSTAPGSEQFDLVHIAPWGDMRIDGQSVPRSYVLQRFRAIKLAPGTHALDYSAPPFAPLHCILTVPANPTGDTCPLTQNADDLFPVQNDSVRMLDLRAGFTNLPREQLAALISIASAGLLAASPTVPVAPGEHYLTANGEVATNTHRPMQATLLYQLSHDQVLLPGFEYLHCQTLCFYRSLINRAPDEWGVVAHVTLSWSYVVPHTVLYGPVEPDRDTVDAGVPLHITWQRGWRVTPLKAPATANGGILRNTSTPICVPAQEMTWPVVAQLAGWDQSSFTTADGAEGCLIHGRASTGKGPNPGGFGPPNYLLYRFGVLLAANDQAHRTFPTLPRADAFEQSLAQQLATQG